MEIVLIFILVIIIFLILEAVVEDQVFATPFGCCIQEVLLCCHPTLTEESISARLSLAQRLETTLHVLSRATEDSGQQRSPGAILLLLDGV